jgi:transposase
MNDIRAMLEHWKLDVKAVREQVYRAATPRERERWHALWLLARGWSATQVAEALERDAHTIGEWVERFRQQGPAGVAFEQTGGPPPPLARRNKGS